MDIETTVVVPTHDGKEITLHLRNTMRQDIRYAVFRGKFAEGQPDRGMRDDFCYLWARVDRVEGVKLPTLTEASDMAEFERLYYGFAERVHHEDFIAAANAAARMKRNSNPVEKPDEALTDEEQNDPNS